MAQFDRNRATSENPEPYRGGEVHQSYRGIHGLPRLIDRARFERPSYAQLAFLLQAPFS
jgi:hypothetical protein